MVEKDLPQAGLEFGTARSVGQCLTQVFSRYWNIRGQKYSVDINESSWLFHWDTGG